MLKSTLPDEFGREKRRRDRATVSSLDEPKFPSVTSNLYCSSISPHKTRNTKARDGLGKLASATSLSRHLAEDGRGGRERCPSADEALKGGHNAGVHQQFVPEAQRRVVNKLTELMATGFVN